MKRDLVRTTWMPLLALAYFLQEIPQFLGVKGELYETLNTLGSVLAVMALVAFIIAVISVLTGKPNHV